MDPFTPQALFDLYSMLPNEGKTAFLKMVGRISTAHAPFMIVNELPALEKYRFSELVFQPLTSQLFPILEREARRIARDNPGMPDNEFDKQLHESVKGLVEKYSAEIAEVERASLKERRDRHSDPEIVKRNIEICDRRKQDRRRWSIGKLARAYDLSHRAITLVLKDESKWRRLGQETRSN